MPGVLVLVCCCVLFGTAVSMPPIGIEAWRGSRTARTAGEPSADDHHQHDEEATGEAHGQTAVPCHHEDEVIEVFNELVVKWNVTDHTGELCHVDEHHHELLEGDNHTATEKSNMSALDVHEEGSEFCEDVYLVTRELLLLLNYTVESCLLNGTLGDTGMEETDVPSRLDYGTAYGVGFAAVLIVSLVSLLGVCLIPLLGKKIMRYLSSFLVAMGVAALVCDAVLHLIPHSFLSSAEDAHDHSGTAVAEERLVLWKGSVLLGALLLFYIFEFVMKYWQDREKMKLKKKAKCAASKAKCAASSNGGTESELELKDRASGEEASGRESCLESNDNAKVAEEPTIEQKGGAEEPPEGETASAPVCKHHAMLQDEQDRPHYNPHQGFCHGIVPVAWIIILGDAAHNFADGLAIGASFSASLSGGLSTTIAVLFHELPHELGDFAILLSTGMKWYTALFYNFISALTAFIGMFIGVAVGNVSLVALDWILVAVAGIFLYVALVDMLPGLYEVHYKGISRWLHFALQLLAFFLTYGALLVLAYYEHDLENIVYSP